MSIATTKDITIDRQIGRNLRTLRQQAGFNQKELAEILGISCQQVQKYEHGKNRLSAANLWRVSQAFGVSLEIFFHGLAGTHIPVMALSDDDPQTAKILGALCRIEDPALKGRVLKMIRLMLSAPSSGGTADR